MLIQKPFVLVVKMEKKKKKKQLPPLLKENFTRNHHLNFGEPEQFCSNMAKRFLMVPLQLRFVDAGPNLLLFEVFKDMFGHFFAFIMIGQ